MNWLAVLADLETFARTGEHHPHEWVARLSDIREEYEVELEALQDELIREHADAVRAARDVLAQPGTYGGPVYDEASTVVAHAPITIEDALPPPADPEWIGPRPARRRTRAKEA